MILVDTSVWIDHFRKANKQLQELLLKEDVCIHQFIIGELTCGNFSNRDEILSLLKALLQTKIADNDEILKFIELHRLYDSGLGFIDVHLLASAFLSNAKLWTKDKALRTVASKLNCDYKF
ncbi:ribonuclease VapC32 [bacterium BMS3Abin04]|nr:ribonuclease VapC32 [bacterium BMS3Abin04]